MIEEDYKVDIVDEDTAIAGLEGTESALETESQVAARQAKIDAEFTKEDRIEAFQDLLEINKYSRNCPEISSMRTMVAKRTKCSLPDPPFEPAVPEQEEEPEEKKAAPAKGKAKQEEVEEVEVSPEEKAANKMFEDFCDKFTETLDGMKDDLIEYKKLSDPVYGV